MLYCNIGMRTILPPLPALLAFEAVARRRSFALAASDLHLTPSAVSHQVTKLEEFLGTRLFDRTTRGVELSQAGEAYLQRVSGPLGAIGAATDDLRKGMRNLLYVHSTPSFASLWLMARLPKFAEVHPGVSLFLSASPTYSDFSLGQVDVDIRYGTPNWPGLVVRPVLEERVLPLASPEFVDRHRIRDAEELLQAPLIPSTVSIVQWRDWFASRGIERRPDRFALRFDRAQLALDAAVHGLGVALESTALAQGYIDAGRLQPVLDPAWAIPVNAHYVVCPPRHAERREVAIFLDWLADEAAPVPPEGPATVRS